jgi:hypothetical protein
MKANISMLLLKRRIALLTTPIADRRRLPAECCHMLRPFPVEALFVEYEILASLCALENGLTMLYSFLYGISYDQGLTVESRIASLN